MRLDPSHLPKSLPLDSETPADSLHPKAQSNSVQPTKMPNSVQPNSKMPQPRWLQPEYPSSESSSLSANPARLRWLIRLLSLLLLGGCGWLLSHLLFTMSQSLTQVETVAIEQRTLPIIIRANGTVQPERLINISPKRAGILKNLLVNEGDTVQQGQILAYMDDKDLQTQITQAEAKLGAAQFNLQKLQAGKRPQEVAEAKAKLAESLAHLKSTDLTLNQNQMLYSSGAVSRRELETSQATRDAASAQVTQAEQSLSLQLAGSRSEDIAAAKSEVIAAQGAVAQIRTQLDDTIIRAPFQGRVIRKYADPGAFVAPTTAASAENSATSSSILAIATENQIVANVSEVSLKRLRIGQKAQIKADAFPDRPFQGKIIAIAPQSTVEQNVTTFEVKISLNDSQALLRAGMNVEISVEVGSLNSAIVVPTVAIVRQESGTGVYIKNGDQVQFQPIETGMTVGNQTEVRSGLKGNEQILLSFPEGARQPSLPFLP